MSTKIPNPEVYRLAAKLVHSGHLYEYDALAKVCLKLGVNFDLYWVQYRVMFASHMWSDTIRSLADGLVYVGVRSSPLNSGHPWWAKDRKQPEAQKLRILSLLLMADIVENPIQEN